MPRLFVAVFPPEEARGHLAALVADLAIGRPAAPGRSLRLTKAWAWHVTLAFIGEVPEAKVEAAERALRRTAEGWTGVAPEPRFAGGGVFGGARRTVIWTTVQGGRLDALATSVRRELKQAEMPFDHKPFRPHVTLARPGDRLDAASLATDLRTLDGYEGPLWTVDSIHLVRSQLGPRPSYDHLLCVPLVSTSRDGTGSS